MENYEGHTPKRQRTDGENGAQRVSQDANFYGYNERASSRSGEEEKINNVLLMTIVNPVYPITVDVINAISTPCGQVLRIVIFKKNGVQALVEFDDVESAKRAKLKLQGADIYSGCCTLKVDYAKPTRLNVYKNDHESFDYTNPTMGKSPDRADRPGPLLQEPRFGARPVPFREGSHVAPPLSASFGGSNHGDSYDGYTSAGRTPNSYGGYSAGQQEQYGPPVSQDRYAGHLDRSADVYDSCADGSPMRGSGAGGVSGGGSFQHHRGGGGIGAGTTRNHQGAVMMVYAVNHEKINCDRLFNLFCLYGNVMRIKFLKSKEGCAMVQMGDGQCVERAIRNLNNGTFFGCRMQLGYSKQAFLNDVQQPYELPDGTPSFKDFMGNRHNRFTNPESAGKNRIQPPSKVLHFFNAPHGVTEEEMKKVFESEDVTPPTSVKLFTSKTERSASGLLEWDGVSAALEALVICNHTPIPNPGGKFPYILKLCFSSSNPRAMQTQPQE